MKHFYFYRIAFVSLAMIFTLGCGVAAFPRNASGNNEEMRLIPTAGPINGALFCLNVISLQYGVAWPTIPFASWRNFHSYWDQLEPEKGKWTFGQLDKEVSLAEDHGVELLLVLGSTPRWASARPDEPGCCAPIPPKGNIAEARNIEDWRNYVRTVAARYKGRVTHYELWNEPNVDRFYSGSVAKLVELNSAAYQMLKEVDPSITVVSSSLSRCCDSIDYLDRFFALGGGQHADVIGYHFYPAPNPPEAMLPRINQVRDLMAQYGLNKPLWNTETGWRVANHDKNIGSESWAGPPLSDNESAAYLARTYVLSWAAGVERLYWYAWGHRSMGMTEFDGKTPKLIAEAFEELQDWLVGTKMLSCNRLENNTWLCTLAGRDRKAWIVWNPDGKTKFSWPKDWRATGWKDLAGGIHSRGGTTQLDIGPVPVLLEGQ